MAGSGWTEIAMVAVAGGLAAGLATLRRRRPSTSAAAAGSAHYDAFVSYSHRLEGAVALAVQKGVEQFAKPWYRWRALRVFRDSTNLTASPGLWSSIELALRASTWLILMASPDAAASPWVAREVDWWLRHKSARRILIVLTEGELHWDTDPTNDDGRSALPPALRGAFEEEPRWVDLRWLREIGQVDRSDPRLRECLADLAAAIRGIPKDALIGEDVRQHRRTIGLAWTFVAVLVAALGVAVYEEDSARRERDAAVAAQHRAIALAMTAQADRIRGTDPRAALQFGVAAQALDPGPQAAGLVQSLTSSQYGGTLSGNHGRMAALSYSPDGHRLATAEQQGRVTVWDVDRRASASELTVPAVGKAGDVSAVAYSPDGTVLAADVGTTIRLWDVRVPDRPRLLDRAVTAPSGVGSALAFAPDAPELATGGHDGMVQLWDIADPEQPRPVGPAWDAHGGRSVSAIAFSPAGAMMATAGLNGTVILWDVSQRDAPHRRGPDLPSGAGSYNGLAFSPDGHTLATADDASVRLWAVDDADHPTLLDPPPTDEHTPVYAVAFSQDGARLAAAGTGADVSVWDLARRNQPVAFAPVDVGGVVFDLTFPDVGTLTTLASTHTVDIWQIADGALRPATQRHTDGLADSARLSADGAVLVTVDDVSDGDDPLGTRNRQIQVWSARGQGDLRPLGGPIASSTARIAVSAAPPYTLVTAELDGTLRLWDVDLAGRVTPLGLPFNENTGIAFAVALSADGHTLAVGSENGTVRFWDLADRSRPRALPPITSGNTIPLTTLAFAPDASLLATVSEDGTGQLWDVADQARRGRFTQSSRSYTPESLALRFSPDGRTLAYSTTDRLMLWDVIDRDQPRPEGYALTGIATGRRTVVFSGDGSMLAAGTGTNLTVWDLQPLDGLRRDGANTACLRAGGALDERNWRIYAPDLPYQKTCPAP